MNNDTDLMLYLTEGEMRGFMKKIAIYNLNEDY